MFRNVLMCGLFFSALFLAACGGGSGGTGGGAVNAALTLAASPTSVGAGSSFSATVTVKSGVANAVYNGLEVQVVSDSPSVIPTVTGFTNNAGVAIIPMQVLPTVTTQKTVTIYAIFEGVKSTTTQITVTPALLTPSFPSGQSASLKDYPSGSKTGWTTVISAQFKDSSGNPVPNQKITFGVKSIDSQITGDQVAFTPTPGNQVISPTGTVTVTTDSTGTATVPLSITIACYGPAPTPGSLHSMTILWEATTQYAPSGSTPVTFTATGTSQYSVTNVLSL